ncbi:4595_t:CDS:10 [Paraglomus occultum]|uniref:4595_t:CDS:1 n=1 Tax=Paraglomus occultum TaxID=144539 RepID=A0A9N8ZL57_9GLOM|nr:4595_t:CDS:10 [Paraglomus occultum]
MIRGFSRLGTFAKSHSLYVVLLCTVFLGAVLAASPSALEKEAFINSLLRPRAVYLPTTRSTDLVKREENCQEECPPCFDCHLEAFPCKQFGNCSDYDGRCQCPPGFGGLDCSKPLCGSLADGKNRLPREDDQCVCSDGWGGINCNVCLSNEACDPLVITGQNGTCYKGGLTVNENFQMCDVTNRKILDMLPNQPPQVTFSCNRANNTCDFQFWINKTESFYCHLDECAFEQEIGYNKNVTDYSCKKIKCECMIGEMLCGKEGSIDLSDWLVEEIKGPASFKCVNSDDCRFDEPQMSELIKSVFADKYITLKCSGGECLHYTQVPGFVRPEKPRNTTIILVSVVLVMAFVFAVFGGVFRLSRNWRESAQNGFVQLPDDEAGKLMTDHTPASLLFQNVRYSIGDKQVLQGIHGMVQPGEVMAIMGASGAGKTSFLDILARKNKAGTISGEIYVNGHVVEDSKFKSLVGYVDQEDHLLPTLTVYETILYSALLRLPREMSLQAKKYRVLETMNELGILPIKDSRIGEAGARSISGGEKRRVSIACELVTSPSILFLDEPTSGLDAYNAYNVIECLVTLARNYNRTVICTIHQPRSNIFMLFDHLLLLAGGYMVYSGEVNECAEYFESIGHKCPPGFNLADYLVDLTMYAVKPNEAAEEEGGAEGHSTSISADTRNQPVELLNRSNGRTPSQLRNRPGAARRPTGSSTAIDVDYDEFERTDDERISEHLQTLVNSYARSLVALRIKDEISQAINSNGDEERPLIASAQEIQTITSHRRASWLTQFKILSDRTFKNLYRNPMLMFTHYCISVYLALLCGALFYQVTNDIAGFQNRMGVLFFMCALFGFGCLSSLHVFSEERILFVKERANGYYAPITYFASKVLFDIIPLRVVPPILMGVIIYHMVGLVSGTGPFLKFILVLVLFNLTSASICLCIGILFKEIGVASLLSSLVMLFSMLFGGLLLNKESIPEYLAWLKDLSFFNYAFEALIVNEVAYLQLTEEKFGLTIDVPGATILSTFGFDAAAYWADVIKLSVMFTSFIILSFVCLQLFVKEKR